jgi:glycosyl transferase family 1
VRAVVYYVSGHGFGHAVRSAEVIRALRRRCPELPIEVRTGAPGWLFPPGVSVTELSADAGVVQPNALEIDELATLERAAALVGNAASLVADQVAALRAVGAGLVVGDVPPLAFLAAAAAGLPSIAVANFSWDWIYQPYVASRPAFGWLLDWHRAAYGQAELLLRLPFHDAMSAFRAIEDVPLISRAPSALRAVLRARLGLSPAERVVLLSFGGLGLDGLQPELLAALPEYTFLATEREVAPGERRPANLRLLPMVQRNYDDIVAACDVVVSKPGFGIVASCLASRVPLLYTDRGNFAEFPILVAGLQAAGRAAYIRSAELLAGRLGPPLQALLALETPWSPPRLDGAEVIATRLLERLSRDG